jgi:hypothetical protein
VHEQGQDLSERRAGRDHLEHLTLTGLKGFRLPQRRIVARNSSGAALCSDPRTPRRDELRRRPSHAPTANATDAAMTDASWISSLVERVRRIVVQHELPDNAAETDQGNEGQGNDPFARQDRQ